MHGRISDGLTWTRLGVQQKMLKRIATEPNQPPRLSVESGK